MSVRFVLRAGDRGDSFLKSTGTFATYVSGHPDASITRHSSFNFHEYQGGIPGFGVMKVFGEEHFTPNGAGYNMHPHHNFIIMAFVLGGTLTHINTIGKLDSLDRDDYYVFSAGSGGKHCELNIGERDAEIIYVWVMPGRLLAPPSYRRAHFDRAAGANAMTCLVGNDAGALPVDQDFKVSRLVSDADRRYTYRADPAHGVYVFVVEGDATIADAILTRRDSIGLEGEQAIDIAVHTAGTDLLIVETRL